PPEKVSRHGAAGHDDDAAQDTSIHPARIVRAGVAADPREDHGDDAVVPFDGAPGDKGDHRAEVREAGCSDLERVESSHLFDAKQGKSGHDEEACSSAKVSDIEANGKQIEEECERVWISDRVRLRGSTPQPA